jgi:transposase
MLSIYRAGRQARRALILLLLAEGRSYREITAAALASPTMIRAVKKDWEAGRAARILGMEERSFVVAYWLVIVVRWLLTKTPQDFGFFRTRWSCALLALLLWEQENIRLSPETVRRGLVRMEFAWRRPRPVVGPRDPEHAVTDAKSNEITAIPGGLGERKREADTETFYCCAHRFKNRCYPLSDLLIRRMVLSRFLSLQVQAFVGCLAEQHTHIRQCLPTQVTLYSLYRQRLPRYKYMARNTLQELTLTTL